MTGLLGHIVNHMYLGGQIKFRSDLSETWNRIRAFNIPNPDQKTGFGSATLRDALSIIEAKFYRPCIRIDTRGGHRVSARGGGGGEEKNFFQA